VNKLHVKIVIGNCFRDAYAQADTDDNTIYFHSEWAVQSELAWEDYQKEENTVPQNMVFTFVKFIHQLFHLFTPDILDLEWTKQKRYKNTPTTTQ
jgi:hypothetical protein